MYQLKPNKIVTINKLDLKSCHCITDHLLLQFLMKLYIVECGQCLRGIKVKIHELTTFNDIGL
jgi:hypothetical protein